MQEFFNISLIAVWLGILTSISPCPLATNIAAISFISRKIRSTFFIIFSGFLYSLGRMAAYVLIGIILLKGIFSMHSLSFFLQEKINLLLGPVLILTGMVLVNLITLNFRGFSVSEKWQIRFEKMGFLSSFPLGFLFALALCPISAALFFGSLIPSAIKNNSTYLMPAIYGLGTGLPVIAFAVAFGFGSRAVAALYDRLNLLEKWARLGTGVILIIIGIYLSLTNIFKIF